MRLPAYQTCRTLSDCYANNGGCLKTVTLNRAETFAGGTRTAVPIQEVPGFEAVPAGSGVCSYDCTQSAEACPTRFQIGANSDPAPWTCQVVYASDSPYQRPDGAALPLAQLPLGSELAAGVPFAAICRPPFERTETTSPDFCGTCSAADGQECLAGSVCLSDHAVGVDAAGADSGHCMLPCGSASDCQFGFTCRALAADEVALAGAGTGSFCMAEMGSCGKCTDRDGDGRGVGACAGNTASQVDCDDANPLFYYDSSDMRHAFPDFCGPDVDANCNGLADQVEQVGVDADSSGGLDFGPEHCGACFSVCTGTLGLGEAQAPALCRPGGTADGSADRCRPNCPVTRADCNGNAADGCELAVTDRSALYVKDCDGDGHGDAAGVPQFRCDGDAPLVIDGCSTVLVLAGSDTAPFGDDCDDAASETYPGASELCDFVDNDCNGVGDVDQLSLGSSCGNSGEVGICGDGATLDCDPSGAVICVAATYEIETCDGLDNDCDGDIDNDPPAADGPLSGAGGTVGAGCTAPGAKGLCATEARYECQAGGIVCIPGTPAATDLPNDGIDSNCDGIDGDLTRAIFVLPGGCVTSCDGSMALPLNTLADAYDKIAERAAQPWLPTINQIYLSTGDHLMPFGLRITSADAGLSIVGGYQFVPADDPDGVGPLPPTTAAYFVAGSGTSNLIFNGQPTIGAQYDICGRGQSPCPSADPNDFEAAIAAVNPRDVLLKQLAITVRKPRAGFGHIAGLSCMSSGVGESCRELKLESVTITVEAGSDGTTGSNGANGSNGVQGAAGQYVSSGYTSTQINASGGSGGSSSCGAGGGGGATAFIYGAYDSSYCGESCGFFGCCAWAQQGQWLLYGNNGAAGSGSPSGVGGARGTSSGVTISGPVAGMRTALDGQIGRPGTAAVGGLGAPLAISPFELRTGATGGTGGPGGGGGGGAGQANIDGNMNAASGSGGGSGGCGGNGGAGGNPAGSVVGLYWDDPDAVNETGLTISAGPGGRGGVGGVGGVGGSGGVQSTLAVVSGWGQASGVGAPGGNGAPGGGGGGGGGGWSVGIARRTTSIYIFSVTAGAGGDGGTAGVSGGSTTTRPKYQYSTWPFNETNAKTLDSAIVVASPVASAAQAGAAGEARTECFIDLIVSNATQTACFSSCRPGTHVEGTLCVPDFRDCSDAVGTGNEFWTSWGGWGGCVYTACNAPYHESFGGCTTDTARACATYDYYGSQSGDGVEQWTETYGWDGYCVPTSCYFGYHAEAGTCLNDSQSCFIPGDGVSTSDGYGVQYWDGAGYGACTLNYCNYTDTEYNGACYPSQRDCSNADGAGYSYFDGNYGEYTICYLSYCYDPARQPVGGDTCLLASYEPCSFSSECASSICFFGTCY